MSCMKTSKKYISSSTGFDKPASTIASDKENEGGDNSVQYLIQVSN